MVVTAPAVSSPNPLSGNLFDYGKLLAFLFKEVGLKFKVSPLFVRVTGIASGVLSFGFLKPRNVGLILFYFNCR